jgi:hypothetical protein
MEVIMDDDGLTMEDIDPEFRRLERAIGLAEALRAPCDFDHAPASPDRIRAVLRERGEDLEPCDEGLVDLVLKLVAHYCPVKDPRPQ